MTYRVPYLSVSGPDGTDMLPIWGNRLVGVKVVTRLFDDVNTCSFIFRNGPPYIPAPAEDTPFTVAIGWSPGAVSLSGIYYMHSIHLSGSPKNGEQVVFECWSGLMSGLDQVGSQHFNADNGHSTLGDVFQTLFEGAGVAVEVVASIAGLPLPGDHLVQWNQSAVDFATDLANNAGGIVKPMGGKIVVLDRNGGQSVSGIPLAGVMIDHNDCYEYDVLVEPRFGYQSVSVPYMDAAAGRLKNQVSESPAAETSGAKMGLPHPAPDQASATMLGKVVADEYRRFTATGLFIVAGEPNAVMGCQPKFTNFPDPISTVKWLAVEVTHDVEPGVGWTTTIETETDPE